MILLKNTLADLKNKMQWSIINILDEFIGETLLFQKYRHLLYDTISIIVHGNFISEHQGTGIVHVAGGFGIDDFNLIKEHHLEAFVPINDDGTFAHDFHDPSLRNVFYLDADKIILKKIKLQKQLLFSEKIVHQYPHDWRSKTPVIYKACWQWFVNIEALKPHLYQIIKQINWFNRGDKCMLKMIADRNDWCISRQRQWGVPIPVFYQKNGEPYINKDFVTYFASLVAEHGIEIWWNASVTELLHPWLIKNNITIDIAGWTKEQDIFDVWFDSGASSYAVWANDDNFVAPDLLIEGYDQFRGWFNASLILGSIMDKKTLPYKAVFSHGFVLDNKGNKMSKSVGNVIDPMDICQDYGADILRLWVVSVDYSDDVRISNLLMDKVSESYRKIRNVFRFLLGNLNDYTYDATDINQFSALDNRIIHEVIKHHEAIKQHYQVINFYKLYQNLMNFIVNDLSALYFETNKDVLYVAAQTDPKRKAVQTVLYFILDMLLKCWKPILVHTCEEVFTHWKHHYTSKSVHLLPFKLLTIASKLISPNNDQQWKLILEFRKDVFKYLEQLKIEKTINVTLEVHLKCVLKTDYVFIKDFLNTTLPDLLMISKITFSDEADAEHWHTTSSSYLQAVVGWGQKCQRCWKISTTMILIDKQHVCNNCHKILTQR